MFFHQLGKSGNQPPGISPREKHHVAIDLGGVPGAVSKQVIDKKLRILKYKHRPLSVYVCDIIIIM